MINKNMNQKQIGILIVIVGLLLAGYVLTYKYRDDQLLNKVIAQEGSCFLADGTCLHEARNYNYYILGGMLAGALIVLGIYLVFFDRTQEMMKRHQRQISMALRDAQIHTSKKDKFEAFLSGFNEEERKVLKAIREHEGIKQASLRYKIGMSKTGLSLLLKSLEGKDIISREPDGKTNKIYLREKY